MNRLIRSLVVPIMTILLAMAGCFSGPDIKVDASAHGNRRVDNTPIPRTSSHEDARAQLRSAYHEIDRLRAENNRLKQRKKELEDKLDD